MPLFFAHCGKIRNEGTILLFIDEIQNSAKAVALLRYFYEELPDIYVIAAGSLLENLIDVRVSFPVGRVQYMASNLLKIHSTQIKMPPPVSPNSNTGNCQTAFQIR